ncbi:hypothetical protein GTQ99_06870 [Kineococcus sp. T13]|uniref:hypothetical protein n=1 Tax=Kineococcus vitellinus TaxID=2696565 RepID=UPI0014133ACE|nr:hypothetical protein [Kineococcus vitellinus]NAZ75145.1 hypothetical protein [Kineococcus vitellinus]
MDAPSTADLAPDPARVLRLWSLGREHSAAQRVTAFLRALAGAEVDDFVLGRRNQAMLRLHQHVVGRPIDAVVVCPGCGTSNEFVLPVPTVLGLPEPPADASATVVVDGRPRRFRLPTLGDLAAVTGLPAERGLAQLAAATRTGADASSPPSAVPDRAELDHLLEAWEDLDPAGAVRVTLTCSGCGEEVLADADPAGFVARDLDLHVEGLMRDVDVIAGRYGWSEDAIVDLPVERRRRYVDLITGARRSMQPVPALVG